MHLGDLEVHLVSDGQVWVDPGGPFGLVPRALYERVIHPDGRGLLPEMLSCLLLRSEGQTILVDTGLGDKLDKRVASQWHLERPGGGLVDGLGRLGVRPEEVDQVICTHLHSDHCGGNTRREGENPVATFPRAEYLVQRMEWADASHPNLRTRATYYAENFAPLLAEGRLRLLHGDEQITSQVRCVVTPGHTRGHQSVLLSSGEWHGLFVSDMATFAVQMARAAWVTSFDVEPLENIETKLRWQRWALDHDAWLFFIHDPLTPVARLAEDGGRLDIVPIEQAQPLIDSLPTLPRPAE